MLTMRKFSGINNVQPPERLVPTRQDPRTPLTQAINVDVGLDDELRRRAGYAQVSALCHKNVHEAEGFVLSTSDGGDLTTLVGAVRTVVYPSLGVSRVWYCDLPDGRTAFSNGLIRGIASASGATEWGVPIPASVGAAMEVAGSLHQGTYRYCITHVRLSDGLEGGTTESMEIQLTTGGFVLTGLPTPAGYKTNVYLTGLNGEEYYLAGSTTTAMFSFSGRNDQLILPCRTRHMQPPPAGKLLAFWRGRALVAVDGVLYASRPHQVELFDLGADFKQFSSDITLVQPVDGGIFVGTGDELAFLSGAEFSQLAYRRVADGPVVLGSGVSVRGEYLRQGEGTGLGSAMLCIAAGVITAGFNDGDVVLMTRDRYRTNVSEVVATFRITNGIPQYIAIPQ